MEDDDWDINMGRLGRLTTFHYHKHAKATSFFHTSGSEYCMNYLWFIPLSKTSFWVLKNKSCGNMTPQNNWVGWWNSFQKKTNRHLSQGTWRWLCVSLHSSHNSLWEEWIYNGVLKNIQIAICSGIFKHWDANSAEVIWLINTRVSANWPGPTQTNTLHTVEENEVPIACFSNCWGKSMCLHLLWEKSKRSCDCFCSSHCHLVDKMDGEIQCVPQGDLTWLKIIHDLCCMML